ncbi:MAG: 6-carboxytetrahydropterin synthase [Candidatus Omnitrophica bacterium]|nr:6-carboxytetrahydropterin synthase [Candidatus Omnitrophota bacterium]MCM8791134.1 6-carboxytetrahydropterin synthase [Candidatus Omnitrophota bacterium]
MFEIRVKSYFSSAHNLENYHGKCEKLHGHNWIVEAAFIYHSLDNTGLAIDFRIAKQQLAEVLEALDHSYLNELKILKGMNPTSENLAKFIFEEIRKKNSAVSSVSVWESESSCATYRQS